MTPEARNQNQTAFMRESQGVMIMCCTSAFAMGVDKANVNAVIHYGICDSIMEYVQGAERAKRNRDAFITPGMCILLTSDEQMEDLRQFRLRGQHGKAKIIKEQQLDQMIHYVNTTKCRRYAIHSVLDPVGSSRNPPTFQRFPKSYHHASVIRSQYLPYNLSHEDVGSTTVETMRTSIEEQPDKFKDFKNFYFVMASFGGKTKAAKFEGNYTAYFNAVYY
ncbi:hypothetical protein FB192DRAFT_1345214 [Mucor lusitanicus]|uniref:DNA 3'-5' helicase n=2 Tax=Mucor circinelloides f. lusitanicus TaxID=29924 RepID=A0A168NSR0_MUCCL|nr:hypothetical protein FB192DRAFT_1345214 [Mucor lusitanicus]OAD06685.1 hypothetical protein MUCCIDRAFT_78281 [Mucor lusitanicus CBS 277.49]